MCKDYESNNNWPCLDKSIVSSIYTPCPRPPPTLMSYCRCHNGHDSVYSTQLNPPTVCVCVWVGGGGGGLLFLHWHPCLKIACVSVSYFACRAGTVLHAVCSIISWACYDCPTYTRGGGGGSGFCGTPSANCPPRVQT